MQVNKMFYLIRSVYNRKSQASMSVFVVNQHSIMINFLHTRKISSKAPRRERDLTKILTQS